MLIIFKNNITDYEVYSPNKITFVIKNNLLICLQKNCEFKVYTNYLLANRETYKLYLYII